MKHKIRNLIFYVVFSQSLVFGGIRYIEDEKSIGLENNSCRIVFDRASGSLRSFVNLATKDDYLKGAGGDKGTPFRIYRDFTKEYELEDVASAMSRSILRPGDFKLADIRKKDGLTLVYSGHGLEAVVHISMKDDTGTSEWSFQVKNIGNRDDALMVSFPCLEGVVLGQDSATNLQTRHKGDSTVVPAWAPDEKFWEVEFYLNMQWHALWDPPSRNVLGFIFKDARALPKKLLLKDKDIELFYYPPVTLSPGKTLELPRTEVLAYQGSWRAVARAYKQWYGKNIPAVRPPEWFINSDSWAGYHFAYGKSPVKDDDRFVMESFRDMAKKNIRAPFDNCEFALYCQGSADYGVHTDGTNIVREDMGGAAALREGIAGIHRLGLHTTLYIEGYIVPDKSELLTSGRAKFWRLMHKDGTFEGPYTKNGFSHMCPGCAEWQDHLARTAARLLRETGADGIRLDSLGYWYLPCYNPAHHHKSPFDYNAWVKELLAKVRKAALEANPNALLTTEAAMDWYGQWFNGSLIQRYSREVPPIRLGVGSYRPYIYSGGPVWGSLSGLAGGKGGGLGMDPLEKSWLCARFGVHKTLVWGDIADDDPAASDPEIVTRCFIGDKHRAIVAARPRCQELTWPDNVGISDKQSNYTVTAEGFTKPVKEAFLCDIAKLQWSRLAFRQEGEKIQFELKSNWALAVFIEDKGPAAVSFDELPVLHPGESTEVSLRYLLDQPGTEKQKVTAAVTATGLKVTPQQATIPGRVTLSVPADALPGFYAVSVSGKNVIGFKRFLEVK
jgi:hypothetical protein